METLVSETDWTAALAGLPAFEPPRGPVVFVAPHPDDETLAAGGLLASLAEAKLSVTVVAVTDGDAAYDPGGDSDLGALRCREQTAALALLGIPESHILRLGLPDRFVHQHEPVLIPRLVTILETVGRDATLIAPWSNDFHPDHIAVGHAAEIAAARTGNRFVNWFWWSWHRRTIAELAALPLTRFSLEPLWLERKLAALAEHRSQLGSNAILPDELLAPARRSFEVFA
jgi:LmbE family N-acetylglucosaminyl deacetylase